MPTLYEIAKQYKQAPDGKAHKKSDPITEGITPAKNLPHPGYRHLKPNELAALWVPRIHLNSGIKGYQRAENMRHARAVARALGRGEEVPPILVSLDSGQAIVTEGQHRGLAGIIARKSVPAVVKHRTEAEQQRLFANQRRAKPVSPDTIVLAANGLFAEYVQEAVTTDDHPWSGIVGFTRSPTKIGAAQMLALLQVYVGGAMNLNTRETLSDDRFDRGAADLLADLLLVFGSRRDNPLAWRLIGLRAITYAALKVLRRTGEHPADIERWMRHMPGFPFTRHSSITTSRELSLELIRHWNKRLSPARQIT